MVFGAQKYFEDKIALARSAESCGLNMLKQQSFFDFECVLFFNQRELPV